ncbi:MAG: hypothetical protein AAF610_06430 [Pseudomonadota bacterium]
MNTLRPILITAGAALISACGSGPSDAPDARETGEPATSLTLSGIVTDNPIVNASVMVRVADTEFGDAPPTGSNGEFQVDISSTQANALVVAEAMDAVNGVRLSAVLDTFSNFEARARNGRVDGVKITNVTTAAQVLAERLAVDGSVDSVDEYRELLERVDADTLYELSAAIKVVVENIGGTTLPAGISDTAALARAVAAGNSSFLTDLATSSPTALATARARLLTDGNATIPFDTNSAPGVYAAIEDNFIYAVFGNGTALVDYREDVSVPGTPAWSLNSNGQIDIRFFGFERTNDKISAIGQVGDVMHVVRETDFGNAQAVEASGVHKFGFGTPFAASNAPGTWLDGAMETSRWVFETSGLGYRLNTATQVQEETFAWSVTADGRLSLDFDDSNEVLQFQRIDSGADDVLVIRRFGGEATVMALSTLVKE